MKWFAETTEWQGFQANHCYLMDDSRSKMYAYARFGERTAKVFEKPIPISVRGRQFKAIADRWHVRIVVDKPTGREVKITGSRGDTYIVSEQQGQWNCTCSGFRFRGDCRHIKQVQSGETQ